MPSAVSRLTEQNIAHWNDLFARRPRWRRYPTEDLVGLIDRAFPDSGQRRGLSALEVACGPGYRSVDNKFNVSSGSSRRENDANAPNWRPLTVENQLNHVVESDVLHEDDWT